MEKLLVRMWGKRLQCLNRGTYRASDDPKGKVPFSPNAVWSLLRRELWLLIVTRRYRWRARNRWTAEGEEVDEKSDRFRDPTGNSNNDNLMFLQEFATLSGWMVRVICRSKVIKVYFAICSLSFPCRPFAECVSHLSGAPNDNIVQNHWNIALLNVL